MVLTIRTTHKPATDLGYLLHKNPHRVHEVDLAFGKATVFFPEVEDHACTAAVVVDVDPIELVRGRTTGVNDGLLRQYVNDRPYAASSLLATALTRAFGTALSGRSKEKPELVDVPLPFEVTIGAISTDSGRVKEYFEPLGYEVDCTEPLPGVRVVQAKLTTTQTIAMLLRHLYVLIPALDHFKHYWVSEDEVEKLLRKGEGWLESHPAKNAITRRYLKHQVGLTRAALARMAEDEGLPDEDEQAPAKEEEREPVVRLHDARLNAVFAVIKESGARSVADLGCGEGRLLSRLIADKQFTRIVGMDVSSLELLKAERRLRLDRLGPRAKDRIELIHGSLVYSDARLRGFDAAALVEVIEHLDESRLEALRHTVFAHARPSLVAVTTPNREYNSLYDALEADAMRHADHRFEWTRAEFEAWCVSVAEEFRYTVSFSPVGPMSPDHGAPSQMGVFRIAD